MASKIYYQFFYDDRLLGEGAAEAPFTVGRQSGDDETSPVAVSEFATGSEQFRSNSDTARKLVIVPVSDRTVPRLSLRVELDQDRNIAVHNIHTAYELQLEGQLKLRPQEQLKLIGEGFIYFADHYRLNLARLSPASRRLRTTPVNDGNQSFLAIDYTSEAAGSGSTRMLSMINEPRIGGQQELAVDLVRTALEAFQEPPGSTEFFAAAGRAAIKMIDLERVAVLLKKGSDWVCQSQAIRPGLDHERMANRSFSQTLLHKMEAASKTMIVEPQLAAQSMVVSMMDVDRAVASPIFDDTRTLVGALYGERTVGGSDEDRPIGELEAALLEVLATGISSSLAIQQEQRLRSSMSQFFSPVVLSQLTQDQTLLNGRETDVTVLFCDIRGFSSVTEKIGPGKAIQWINDVLTRLSQCILATDGVLVDYVGDQLMAMWGAPAHQPDHAVRACRAALALQSQIKPIIKSWPGVAPEGFGLGIGISSGPAGVGNTGSKKKFKYGPMGNTVNLASRVQGITKQIGVPTLLTGETLAAASEADMPTRRIAKVRVLGIQKPFDLYQLLDPPAMQLATRYERALAIFEQNSLEQAAGLLAALVQEYPRDRPTIILLSRTVECLTDPDREFDPVWHLTRK